MDLGHLLWANNGRALDEELVARFEAAAAEVTGLAVTTVCSYNALVRIEWDEAKRRNNLRKHGLDFADTEAVFKGDMGDDDIDFSDIPEVPPEMFAKALVRKGLKPVQRKVQLTLRVDSDVLSWFKRQGKGYQTRINSILRAYKQAHETGG